MPPQATASLRAYCNQKLELEDESYCYRLPFTYVPAYMGNVSNQVSLQMQEGAQQDPSILEVLEVQSMPDKTRSSGLWDIQLNIKGQGRLERIASLNHPIKVQTNAN